MRKKALIEQNLTLFRQLETLRGENAANMKKIHDLQETIEQLKQAKVTEKPEESSPLKKLHDKVIENSKLNPAVEYAAEVIGKLVMESANGSNKLTAGGNTEHRELVNLLLGKTEVAKAEILEIVSGDFAFEVKKEKIDDVAENAIDYFNSILAQLN